MGISNYIPEDDDQDTGPGGNGPTGTGSGGGMPSLPPMSNMAKPGSDIEDILINYNKRFEKAIPLMFRDEIIAQMCSVLIAKTKPNVLKVGPAGVGKTALTEELARRIAVGDASIPAQMRKSTIYELPLSNIIAGAGIVGELETRVAAIVDFATDKSNDAIIFIDEIHLLHSKDPSYEKVAQILKPTLARGDMRVIGATTMNEAQNLAKDPAFERRFTRLIVDELTREQTVHVLFSLRDSFTQHYKHKVVLSDEILSKIATVADENSKASSHRPDNAITLMDRAMSDVVISHSTAIAKAEEAGDTSLVQTLKGISTLPLTEKKLKSVAVKLMTGMAKKEPFDEARILASLAAIKGQDSIIDDIVNTLRRENIGAFPRTRPLAWMFAGPSGVGKTQLTKLIAQEVTGQGPIILNMNEFHTQADTSKILGSPPGYVGSESNRELPFDTLESNPYRVILLDEIEKADKTVHRLLLNALDEGWMRMANGKVIDFSKAIIIATTNAAREAMNRAPVGFQVEAGPRTMSRQELTKALQQHFDAEFLGRFTALVAFNPLNRSVYGEILQAFYERERERIAETDPSFGAILPQNIDAATLDSSVATTYLVDQGARPAEAEARRLIEDILLNATAAPRWVPQAMNDDEEEHGFIEYTEDGEVE